jgi:hypothetical protein
MPLCANQAVRGPNTERIALIRIQRLHVINPPFSPSWICRRPDPANDITFRDNCERRGVLALAINPEDGVSDVNQPVAIKRDMDVRNLITDSEYHFRQALHICVSTSHKKLSFWVTKVNLRIDYKQIYILHISAPIYIAYVSLTNLIFRLQLNHILLFNTREK